jgi:hypothetical protein
MNGEINSHGYCGFAGGRVKKMLSLVLLVLSIFLVFKTVNYIVYPRYDYVRKAHVTGYCHARLYPVT